MTRTRQTKMCLMVYDRGVPYQSAYLSNLNRILAVRTHTVTEWCRIIARKTKAMMSTGIRTFAQLFLYIRKDPFFLSPMYEQHFSITRDAFFVFHIGLCSAEKATKRLIRCLQIYVKKLIFCSSCAFAVMSYCSFIHHQSWAIWWFRKRIAMALIRLRTRSLIRTFAIRICPGYICSHTDKCNK